LILEEKFKSSLSEKKLLDSTLTRVLKRFSKQKTRLLASNYRGL